MKTYYKLEDRIEICGKKEWLCKGSNESLKEIRKLEKIWREKGRKTRVVRLECSIVKPDEIR